MKVLVTGGTGLLGREVVNQLTARGHDVRILSRRQGPNTVTGDLLTGAGLPEALSGIDTIVHLASDPKRPKDVDVDGTRRLLDAAKNAGTPHLVYISIVGIDQIPMAYYRAKLTAEQLVEQAETPKTILRATQFHEFTADLLGKLARLPIAIAPRNWLIEPVDVPVVAAKLADAVDAGPCGRLPDLAGPEKMTWADAVRTLQRANGRTPRVLEIPVPGKLSAAWRNGAATAAPTPGRSLPAARP